MTSPSELATRYESLAREFTRSAKKLEGLRKKPTRYGQPSYFERIETLHQKISDLYKKEAEQWMKTGRRNKALEAYRNSEEYAWGTEDKDNLTKIIEKLSQPRHRSLFSGLSIVFLIGSLFFISFSLTGNSISNLSTDNLTLAGTGLFILGLVFAFFYIQKKKR